MHWSLVRRSSLYNHSSHHLSQILVFLPTMQTKAIVDKAKSQQECNLRAFYTAHNKLTLTG